MNFLFLPENSASVGAIGLLISVFGTLLTLVGLYLTYQQASKAQTASKLAREEVEKFKFRMLQYDAFRDLSSANIALGNAKKHINNGAWRDASDSYEDAREAIIRVQFSVTGLSEIHNSDLTKICSHLQNFCEKVDLAIAGKSEYPTPVKVLATIRRHYQTIAKLELALKERAASDGNAL